MVSVFVPAVWFTLSLAMAQTAPGIACPTTPEGWNQVRRDFYLALDQASAFEYATQSPLSLMEMRNRFFECRESPEASRRAFLGFSRSCFEEMDGLLQTLLRVGNSRRIPLQDASELARGQESLAIPAPFSSPDVIRQIQGARTIQESEALARTFADRLPPGSILTRFDTAVQPADLSGGTGRFLAVIPGPRVTSWVQVVLRHALDGSSTTDVPVTGVSVVSVEHHDESGRPVRPPVVRFRDQSLQGSDLRTISPHAGSETSCVACHVTGPLVPKGEPNRGAPRVLFPPGGDLPSLLRPHLAAEFRVPGLETQHLGPSFDSVDAPTRQATLDKCLASADASTRSRIGQAMNCASCHNGVDSSRLYQIHRLRIEAVVRSGHMPPGSAVSESDRSNLLSCLQEEMRNTLQPQWIQSRIARADCVLPPPEAQTGRCLPRATPRQVVMDSWMEAWVGTRSSPESRIGWADCPPGYASQRAGELPRETTTLSFPERAAAIRAGEAR
jgi:hypothetical protein